MQKVDPLVKQIVQLVDARLKTFGTNIKGEIIAAVNASEERMTKKMQSIEDKLDGKVNKHEKRITHLEEHTGLTPIKN